MAAYYYTTTSTSTDWIYVSHSYSFYDITQKLLEALSECSPYGTLLQYKVLLFKKLRDKGILNISVIEEVRKANTGADVIELEKKYFFEEEREIFIGEELFKLV